MSRTSPQSDTVKCEQAGKRLPLAPRRGRREPSPADHHEEGMTSSSVLICIAHHRQLSVGGRAGQQISPRKTIDDTFPSKDDSMGR